MKKQSFSGGEKAYCELDESGDVYRPVSMAWPNKHRAPDEYFLPLLHPTTNKPCPIPARGWRNPPQTMQRLLAERLILFGADESTQPTRKYLLKENLTENVPSLLYFAGSDDDLQTAMGYRFANPKPLQLAESLLTIATRRSRGVVLDCFAGSGTTGHAVINLNRRDAEPRRKYILADLADNFGHVLAPRVKKAIYSSTWKDGKPASRDGISQLVKCLRLESYEDSLNNIESPPGEQRQTFLDAGEMQSGPFELSYLPDLEKKRNRPPLGVESFRDSQGYTLDIDINGKRQAANVDLVETFNWLLGLSVATINVVDNVLFVTGTNPDGERVLVVWRNVRETDNAALDAWFKTRGYNSNEQNYDLIYVNGNSTLESLRRADHAWQVLSIEEEFQRLMFDSLET